MGSEHGAEVRIDLDANGAPAGAVAEQRIAAPVERVWQVLSDIKRYPERVPMIHRVTVTDDRVDMQLRFRIAVLSAKFGFAARITREEGRWIELTWLSGQPAEVRLRFEVEPVDDGAAALTRVAVSYDVMSLGWLVKYFLRHHPEIQFGMFPGTALALLDAVRRAAI